MGKYLKIVTYNLLVGPSILKKVFDKKNHLVGIINIQIQFHSKYNRAYLCETAEQVLIIKSYTGVVGYHQTIVVKLNEAL